LPSVEPGGGKKSQPWAATILRPPARQIKFSFFFDRAVTNSDPIGEKIVARPLNFLRKIFRHQISEHLHAVVTHRVSVNHQVRRIRTSAAIGRLSNALAAENFTHAVSMHQIYTYPHRYLTIAAMICRVRRIHTRICQSLEFKCFSDALFKLTYVPD
jgi:hypothetical protein